MKTLDDHFLCVYLASSAACDLIDILPDVDLVVELEEILLAQLDILSHMVSEKHYGTSNLAEFIAHTQDVKTRCRVLKQNIE